MIAAILIILIFIVLSVLMVLKKISALMAMPIMAVFIALAAGCFSGMPLWGRKGFCVADFIFSDVIASGSFRLAEAMTYAIFGAVLSQIVQKTGIAEQLVRTAAELAGDRKFTVAVVLTFASAIVFGSLTGLGGFIMVSSLVLPVMTAAGISPVLASSLVLFSLSIGGIFNPSNWGFYKNALSISLDTIKHFSISYAVLLSICCAVFLICEYAKEKKKFFWAVSRSGQERNLTPWALITPILPILLIVNPLYPMPVVPAFIIASLYGALIVNFKKSINLITSSFIEGIKDIAPVIGLFIGIGMLLNAVSSEVVSLLMKPFLQSVIPSSKTGYVLFFFILAPLALYRGPFNLYGLGSGFAAVAVSTGILSPQAVMGAFLSVGQIQGICDPTNTHNVWIAQYMKISAEDILRKTIAYVWGFVLISLIYSVFFLGVLK